MEPATGARPSPTRANPASLILAFFFSSKNFLGQREKSQEPSVYQASFYQICVKGQRGKIMGAKLHKQHLHFVWSQKCQPPHLLPKQALPSPNSTLGKEGTAHLQGVSLGPWQGAPCAQGHAVITKARVPAASNDTHRAHERDSTGPHTAPPRADPHTLNNSGNDSAIFHITIIAGWIAWRLTAKDRRTLCDDQTHKGPEAAGGQGGAVRHSGRADTGLGNLETHEQQRGQDPARS